MSIQNLKILLTKVKEMEDAGIKIPDNLLQGIASLARQLEPFLKDSHQKAEFDAIERRELIMNIFFSLWRIFYDEYYQGILLEYKKNNQFCHNYGEEHSKRDQTESLRKKDASEKLTIVHKVLLAEWKFTIPPLIEQIRLPDGYLGKPSLTSDARPLSFEEYVQYQKEKKSDDIYLNIENWFSICHKLTIDEQSYKFLGNPESDIALGEEAMKMCGSMTYEEIFRLLNKEYSHSISDNFDIYDD